MREDFFVCDENMKMAVLVLAVAMIKIEVAVAFDIAYWVMFVAGEELGGVVGKGIF